VLVRAIEVEGLNCFGTKFRVGGLSDSVNILFGPNGIGKSSLIQGISLAFLRPHRTMAESVERFRPWNRTLQPSVMVEFEHARTVYRISKRFLYRPEAKLERREAGLWNLFAQGDGAETVLQDILKSAGGRAASAQDMTGFAQVLWTTQGKLALPALGESVVAAVRASVGEQITDSSRDLERSIADAYATVFTRSGRPKEGQHACEPVRLETQLTAADAEAARFTAAVKAYEMAVGEISALELKALQGTERERLLAAQVAGLQERSKRYTEVASKVRELQARHDAGLAALTAVKNAIDGLRQTRGKVRELDDQILRLEQKQTAAAAYTDQVKGALEAAKALVAGFESRQSAAQNAISSAALAADYVHVARRSQELQNKNAQIAQANIQIHSAEQDRKSLRVPAPARFQELRSNTGKVAELRQRLDLARVKLSFTPERDCEIRIAGSNLKAVPGQPLELAGDPNLAFSIIGVGQFAVAGPVNDFESTQRALKTQLAWLDGFGQEFGTSNLDEITNRCERDRDLEAAIKADKSVVSSVLAGTTEAALIDEVSLLKSRLQRIEALHPEWIAGYPDAQTMSEAANKELKHASEALAQARNDERAQQSAHLSAERDPTECRSKLDSLRKQLEEAKRELTKAEADGKTDAQREKELTIASAEFIDVRTRCQTAEQERDALGSDPALELEKLATEHKKSVEGHSETLRQLNLRRGKLEQLCAEDPYLQLSRAEETQQDLRERLAAATLKTQALALLKKTLDEVRDATLASVSEPVETAASGYLERICGAPLARIRLNADFASQGVIPSGHLEGNCVPDERMSGGEREQIHLCTRLALATELARDDKHLVIFDDVLTITDAERMKRINELIEECGERLQIVILTCHPDRFQSMRNANFIDLPALLCRAQKEVA
jgi:uncharacterized protein YhaN